MRAQIQINVNQSGLPKSRSTWTCINLSVVLEFHFVVASVNLKTPIRAWEYTFVSIMESHSECKNVVKLARCVNDAFTLATLITNEDSDQGYPLVLEVPI